MGCAVTAKCSPRALLCSQRETHKAAQPLCTGTQCRQPRPGRRWGRSKPSKELEEGSEHGLGGAASSHRELLLPLATHPAALALGCTDRGPAHSSCLAKAQRASMKGRARKGQGKAASSPGCLAGQSCIVTASWLRVLSHPELAMAPCIPCICLLPCEPGLKHIPGQAQTPSYPNLCCQRTQLTLTPSRRCNFWDVGLCMKHNAINSSASQLHPSLAVRARSH